ncbi:MAG: bacteriohopanetetrol glucosamine biosynthesis glycosyltransferase HpnI [Elusimicrobiota bacterium]|nr:MAG: bacteriohopanetetrol glucosamine biosynthesis glycosyltransferase HpnI [Elusimicrobiota bacterium]
MEWEILGLFMLASAVAGRAAFSAFALGCGAFTLAFVAGSIPFARRFLLRRTERAAAPQPPITIIKPLKGDDLELHENLASFARQDYPCFQILFCLANPDDPALAAVTRLKKEFPEADIEVVVSKNRIGYNPKVNNMANAYPFAKYDLLMMSDSDIRVEPGFLKRMAAPFEDSSVGLVTSFYQASGARGLWGCMEALSINAHFLPQAAFSAAFGMRFAMGAAMMVRRQAFEATGAFANLADHLADDFWLGESVREAGWRLEAAEGCVDSVPGITSGMGHFKHLVRWARTIRLCQPAGFYASLIQHGFSLTTLRLLVHGPDLAGLVVLGGIWAAKAAAASSLSAGLGNRQPARALWLLPLSEWFSFAAWLGACASNTVLWRGELFVVQSQGYLKPVEAKPAFGRPSPASL